MAMAANMPEMRPVSTGCGFPQLDRIAFGIVDAGKSPDAFHLLDLGNVDAGLAEPLDQLVEPIDAEMLAIPALERVRIIRPEEQSANSSHRHCTVPLMKLAAARARAVLGNGTPCAQGLGKRALVEIVELSPDRKPVRQLAEANGKSFY